MSKPSKTPSVNESKALSERGAEWLLSALVAFVHAAVLMTVASRVTSVIVVYLVLMAPAIVLLAFRGKETIRKGRRWLAIWVISFFSVIPTPALFIGETWVLHRIWSESGKRLTDLRPRSPKSSWRALMDKVKPRSPREISA